MWPCARDGRSVGLHETGWYAPVLVAVAGPVHTKWPIAPPPLVVCGVWTAPRCRLLASRPRDSHVGGGGGDPDVHSARGGHPSSRAAWRRSRTRISRGVRWRSARCRLRWQNCWRGCTRRMFLWVGAAVSFRMHEPVAGVQDYAG
jgi:hypothetical protein